MGQRCPGWAEWVAGMVRWQRLTQVPASEPSTARARWRGIKNLGEGIKYRTLFYPFDLSTAVLYCTLCIPNRLINRILITH